jgi:hypothetical protein
MSTPRSTGEYDFGPPTLGSGTAPLFGSLPPCFLIDLQTIFRGYNSHPERNKIKNKYFAPVLAFSPPIVPHASLKHECGDKESNCSGSEAMSSDVKRMKKGGETHENLGDFFVGTVWMVTLSTQLHNNI